MACRQLDRLFQRRQWPLGELGVVQEDEPTNEYSSKNMDGCVSELDPPLLPGARSQFPAKLRKVPYVGCQIHAPPSPQLCFKSILTSRASSSTCPARFPEDIVPPLDLEDISESPAVGLPDEVWDLVISNLANVAAVPSLSRVSQTFGRAVKIDQAWRGQEVHISPKALEKFAPWLSTWLPVWRLCSAIVVPNSRQLLAQIAQLSPRLNNVELSWRFHSQLHGAGVAVIDHGLAACRVSDSELVVVGDSSIRCLPGGLGPYFEVCLDKRGEDIGDGANDFGLGVTRCVPDEIDAEDMASVAVEVPRSWVVDFTRTSVSLSVNDQEAASGNKLTSADLQEGDRVGLCFVPNGPILLFVNGILRETFSPMPDVCVPPCVQLYPVVDLCGRSVQISRSLNVKPTR